MNRGDRTESLWEGNLPLRGSLRGRAFGVLRGPLRDPLWGRFPSQRLSVLLPLIVLPLEISPRSIIDSWFKGHQNTPGKRATPGHFQVTVCGVAACPFSRHWSRDAQTQMPLKPGSNHLQVVMSRKCSFSNQARKRSTKTNFWVRRPPGGVGVFHARGGGRKVRARPREFVFLGFRGRESGMFREFARMSRTPFFVPQAARRPPDYSSNLCLPKIWSIWLFLGGCFGPASFLFLV